MITNLYKPVADAVLALLNWIVCILCPVDDGAERGRNFFRLESF